MWGELKAVVCGPGAGEAGAGQRGGLRALTRSLQPWPHSGPKLSCRQQGEPTVYHPLGGRGVTSLWAEGPSWCLGQTRGGLSSAACRVLPRACVSSHICVLTWSQSEGTPREVEGQREAAQPGWMRLGSVGGETCVHKCIRLCLCRCAYVGMYV